MPGMALYVCVCYQFLMIFHCFGIFPLDHTGFFTFMIPGSGDIVQVVQTVLIELQKGEITYSIESVPKVSHLWGKMDFL